MFEIGEVLGSRGNVKAKKLKQGGTIFIHAAAAPNQDAGRVILKMQGHKLKNVDGIFSKSDPFVEISAKVNSAGGLTWQPVYRSKQIDNDLNPIWDEIDLNINKLCQGDYNAPILISVYDWEKSGKHKSMGFFETSINALQQSIVPPGSAKHIDTSKAYSLLKNGKDYGKIVITGATVIGAPMPSAAPPASHSTVTSSAIPSPYSSTPAAAASNNTPSYPVHTGMASTAGAVAAATVMGAQEPPKPISYSSLPVQASAPPMMPPAGTSNQRPKFVDYLTGGLELQMCVAIDFTGSNGDPRKPGTLHYIHRDGSLNDYEKAITAVGSVVARYDSDQMFPVWGFGAKFGGAIQHCFQVGQSQEVSGISGILAGYRSIFRTGLTMSGPTVFADVIANAANQARFKQAAKARIGQQAYHILLILTDGAVTDIEQTKQALIAASDAPLSVIIVGIGNADFRSMQFLDDFVQQEAGAGRDICQFVEFSRHQHNRSALTKETLDEVPDQLVDYFYDKEGIMPNPALTGSKFSVNESEYDPKEDMDIDLNFGSGGAGEEEIVIGNPHAGGFDDRRYDTFANYAAPGGSPQGSPVRPMGGGIPPPQGGGPQVFHVQVPPGGYPGMQLQVQNPFTGQMVLATVPNGVQAGQTFGVAS